ncbi:MAG: NAD-dependent DNA ligase LigA, partial [Planctomycetota bacterium]
SWPPAAEPAGSALLASALAVGRLEAVPFIGKEVAPGLAAFFSRPENRSALAAMAAAGVEVVEAEPAAAAGAGPLAGRTFVLTGALSRPRAEVAAEIRAAGGRVAGSVSARTDYLVAGERAGSKLRQAEKHGVRVIDEDGLRRLLEG